MAAVRCFGAVRCAIYPACKVEQLEYAVNLSRVCRSSLLSRLFFEPSRVELVDLEYADVKFYKSCTTTAVPNVLECKMVIYIGMRKLRKRTCADKPAEGRTTRSKHLIRACPTF